MTNEHISYMGYHWIQQEGDFVIVGLNQEALDDLDSLDEINLPVVDEEVEADEICGEISSSEGMVNLYSPVTGVISEVNQALSDAPEVLVDDPYGEGWLYKVNPSDPEELDALIAGEHYEH